MLNWERVFVGEEGKIKIILLVPSGICKDRSSKHFNNFDVKALALHGFHLTEQFRFLIKLAKYLTLFHNKLKHLTHENIFT